MPTPESDPSHTTADQPATNLFVDGDPEPRATATGRRAGRPRGSRGARTPNTARADGRVVVLRSSATPAARTSQHGEDARRFELPGGRPGTPRGLLARVDGNARAVCATMATRPYLALVALMVVAVLLMALSWTGLSLRDNARARHAVRRDAHAAMTGAQHRNATLVRRLRVLRGQAGRQQAAATATVARYKARAARTERRLAALRHAEQAPNIRPARSRKR